MSDLTNGRYISRKFNGILRATAASGIYVLSVSSCIGAARAESLQQVIAEAYEKNPILKAQQADTRSTDEPEQQAKAAFGPTLSVSASYDYTNYKQDGFVVQDGFGASVGANINQPIFTSGRLSAQLQRARAIKKIGRENLRASEMGLISAVIGAYVSLQRDEQLVAISRDNVALLEEQLEQTSNKLKYRDATLTDFNQTETRLALGRAQLRTSEGNYESSRETFRKLVGHYPEQLEPLPLLAELPASITDAYAVGETRNTEYMIAKLTEEASKAQLAVTRASRLPNVSISGNIERAPVSPFINSPRRTSISSGVTVSVPIYTSGLLSSREREAAEINQSDYFQVEQTRREMREAIAQSWDQLSATRLALPQYRQAVTVATTAVQGAKLQAVAGYLTAVDVLDATRDLLNSQTAAAQFEANEYLIHVGLLQSMGVLDVLTFAPDVERYDPDSYRPSGYSGLPTGPLVNGIDSLLVLDATKQPELQVEQDDGTKTMAPSLAPTFNK